MTVLYQDYDATPEFVRAIRQLKRQVAGASTKPRVLADIKERLCLAERLFAAYLTEALGRTAPNEWVESVDVIDVRKAMEARMVRGEDADHLEFFLTFIKGKRDAGKGNERSPI